MEPEEETHTLSSHELLHLAENHLRLRNYSLSSQYALESLHSTADANGNDIQYGGQGLRNRAQQIVAVSDVLSTASQTLGSSLPNWYSILGLDTFCSEVSLIRSKFKSLLLLLGPVKSTFPPADEAMVYVWKAWSVLGNSDNKSDFDAQLQAEVTTESHGGEESGSFWTVCPYCYYMYEYARVFEGYCLRCQNDRCRRVFQGISTRSPPPVKSNQDFSFSCMGYFPLGFSQLEGARNGKQFAPWSPFVGMFDLPDKRTTAKSKGLDDYAATVEVSDDSKDSEAPVHNGDEQTGFGIGSHVGNGSSGMNSYTVTASGKMLMQGGTPFQMNRTANLTDVMDNRGVAMEANFDQYEGEYGFASQERSRAGYQFDPEADMQFVEKDGEIFLEMSPGGEI